MDDPPPLERGDEFYLQAFRQLSTCRPGGMGVYPIPWHHVRDYGSDYGLTGDLLHSFTQIVIRLDAAYLARAAAKMREPAVAPPPTAKPPTPTLGRSGRRRR